MTSKISFNRVSQRYDGVVVLTALLGIAGATWLAFLI
jgi:hypothetical protein